MANAPDAGSMAFSSLLGTLLDGKFQIVKALASGASGDVYEALHRGLGARVAVKVLRPGIPETADIRRKRFMREAQVAARIQSDHVVRVFDIVAPDRGPTYIVMELLSGETLAERVKRLGRLPIAEAIDYVTQAAKPLAEMHDEGIVHRDVKPSNLFLARDKDGKETIKLIDFGVAAFRSPTFVEPGVPAPTSPPVARAESSLTLAESIIGTPRYMAPEQIRGAKNVDGRADVWALGVTLYVLLAGSPPFDAETPLAVMSQIENAEPPPLASKRADVPPELAAIVHRCLAKDPAGRPDDARALLAALARLRTVHVAGAIDLSASSQGVELGRPPPPRPRSDRLAHPRNIAVAVAVVAGGVVLIVVPRWGTDEVSRAALATHAAALDSLAPAIVAAPSTTPEVRVTAPVEPPASVAPPQAASAGSRVVEVAKDPVTPRRPTPMAVPRPPAKSAPRRPVETDDRIE